MTDKQLDSNIELEGQELKAVVGDPEETEILGYGVMYTAGADWNVIVPRGWLLDRMDDLGIPQWVAPSEPRPSSAYKRAMKRLSEDYIETYEIEAPRLDNGVPEPHEVEVYLREGDGRYIRHVYAEVFFDEEESKMDGGKHVQHHLGYFDYDADTQSLVGRMDDDLDKEDHLYEVWTDIYDTAEMLKGDMANYHIGHDIRQMMYYTTRDYTKNVIPLRDGGAVYFFPAGLSEFLDSMAVLYGEIDEQWKEGGATMAVRKFPIFDSDSDWIRQRVEKSLDESIDKALEEAFEEFDEGETADQVVKLIKENLGEDEETAETYNALLEAQLDIEEMLEEKRTSVEDGDKEDIIDRVISQTEVNQF